MKIILPAVLALALVGCAAPPIQGDAPSPLGDGVWSGTLTSQTISPDDSVAEGTSDLLVASCKGVVRIWARDVGPQFPDSAYVRLGTKYRVQSLPDSHMIYYLHAAPTQPDWVEIQTYAFLELDADTAALQWSRAVNNRDIDGAAQGRYFFSQGTTRLTRVNRACSSKLME